MQIKDLKPNEGNPRSVTAAKLESLKRALAEFGDLSGIVFNRKTGRLVGGHQRVKLFEKKGQVVLQTKFKKPTRVGTIAYGYAQLGAERFGYREVVWDEVKEKAANIAANKNAGEWDLPKLSTWLSDINEFGFDLGLTMFDSDELKQFGGIAVSEYTRNGPTGVDEDEVPEKAPARSKLGDIFELGAHRLMCGDSTSIDAVEKLMNGEKADMVFTDPPYGISIVKGGTVGAGAKRGFVGLDGRARAVNYRAVVGDDTPFEPQFILDMGVRCIVLWGANHYASRLPDSPQWIVWDKKLGSGSLDKNNFSDVELAWTNSKALSARIYRHVWAGMLRGGDRKEELSARVHPTQKPVGLCEEVINDFAKGDVLDLFGGSGSTLIACEKTNRRCFMMEIDPHYCDVIVERWEKYTGKTAKLVDRATKSASKKKLRTANETAPKETRV